MTNRIIFLDIDGPMIPSYCWLWPLLPVNPSFGRNFSPLCVAIINELCDNIGAEIVFNSSHNPVEQSRICQTTIIEGAIIKKEVSIAENLKEAAIRNGIPETNIHKDWKTTYGSGWGSKISRKLAINTWLTDHPEVDKYVAFDDVDFTAEENNLVLVDYDVGLTLREYNSAVAIFGGKPIIIL